MKKIIAVAAAASLMGLTACSDADGDAEMEGEADTAAVASDTGVATDPAMTDPAMTDPATSAEVDSEGVRIGVDENGVRADVRDGDTNVRVDADGNPSADVVID